MDDWTVYPNVHTVIVEPKDGKVGGLYLFAEYDDARAFQAVHDTASTPTVYDEQIVISHEAAQRVIEAQS